MTDPRIRFSISSRPPRKGARIGLGSFVHCRLDLIAPYAPWRLDLIAPYAPWAVYGDDMEHVWFGRDELGWPKYHWIVRAS